MPAPLEFEISLSQGNPPGHIVELRPLDSALALTPARGTAQLDTAALQPFVLDARRYGAELFKRLFASPRVLELYDRARIVAQREDRPLRLRLLIHPDAAELHALRWEALYDERLNAGWLLANERFYFARFLTGEHSWEKVEPRPAGELKTIALVANPRDLGSYQPDGQPLAPINVKKELELIRSALGDRPLIPLGSDPKQPGLASLETLFERLRRGCDIVYIGCHGAFAAGKPHLWLEDAYGMAQVVAGIDLAERIKALDPSLRPRLVVLGSCQSASEAHLGSGVLAALGPLLAQAGIPAVLAMQGNVALKTLSGYMPVFFQELLKDGYLERAAAAARNAVRDIPDAWMPALFSRLPEGRLWREPASASAYHPLPLPPAGSLPAPGELPPGHNLPYPRNQNFTGRAADLQALAQTLFHKQGQAAVCGAGGMGKTQLAIELCYRFGPHLHGAHWIPAGLDIPAGIAACGLAMGLQPWPAAQDEQVALTLRHWQTGPLPRLVVFDNAEDSGALAEWLPRLGRSAVLVTSRRPDWDVPGLPTLRLKRLARPDSLALLRRLAPRLGHAPDAELDPLAERLGDLPLALDLAGRYLRDRRGLSPGEYLDEIAATEDALAHASLESWSADSLSPTGHSPSLQATFHLSWQRVADDEDAALVFRLCGYCAATTPIPVEILVSSWILAHTSFLTEFFQLLRVITNMIRWDKKESRRQSRRSMYLAGDNKFTLTDESKKFEHPSRGQSNLAKRAGPAVDKAILYLERVGLLEAGEAGPLLHPLLAEYARRLDSARRRAAWGFLAPALVELADQADKKDLPALFTPLRPHVESAAAHAEKHAMKQAGAFWNETGVHLMKIAAYPAARLAFERALRIDEAAFGPKHPNVVRDVNNLGSVLRDLGDLPAARQHFERALRVNEAAFGPDHPNVATLVNNLGSVLRDLGDLPAARQHFERALRINEAAFGQDNPKVATDVNNLGGVLQELGDLPAARWHFERALALLEKHLPPDHPNIAALVNNLGGVLQVLGDLPAARRQFERALAISEKHLPPNHPHIATLINNLGSVLQDLGDLPAARIAVERALRIDVTIFGLDHPQVAIRLNNLGGVLRDLGDLPAARRHFERALAILEKHLPPDHPHIRLVRENLRALKTE